MQPDLENRITELENRINILEGAAEFDPQIIRAIELLLGKDTGYSVTDYDRSVDESGSASYTVAKVYDGMIRIGDRVIGYYNKV